MKKGGEADEKEKAEKTTANGYRMDCSDFNGSRSGCHLVHGSEKVSHWWG